MRWGIFILVIILFALIGYTGWIIYTQIRARRAGLPPPPWKSYIPFTSSSPTQYRDSNFPSPRSGGIGARVKDLFDRLRNNRTHEGSYEEPLEPGRGYRGGGGADHDEPWDARVGVVEPDTTHGGPPGYYEEQELGMAPPRTTPYDGAGYGGGSSSRVDATTDRDVERGRSRSRDPALGQGAKSSDKDPENPFGDHAEGGDNLRNVSPRPEPENAGRGTTSIDSTHTARRSMFHEGL